MEDINGCGLGESRKEGRVCVVIKYRSVTNDKDEPSEKVSEETS